MRLFPVRVSAPPPHPAAAPPPSPARGEGKGITVRLVTATTFFAVCLAAPARADDSASLAIFDRRIKPIMQAKNPSSCVECHLSGVDLKDFIRPDQAQTFAALREGGLIDVKQPEKSKLLKFIARRPEKPNLITDKVRQEELAAFTAWIKAAVRDKQLLAVQANGEPLGAALPPEVIRHARRDRVLNSFLENIWSEVGRCAACHSPDRNAEQRQKHGERISWIKLNDPQGTLQGLVESDLIDTEQPARSLILLKPTLQVEHGGGQKMMLGDRSYRQFKRFLDDYAAVVQGTYRTGDDLPRQADEASQVSDIWLKLEGVPAKFDKLLLRVDVYAIEKNKPGQTRVATGDRAVFGGGQLWQQHLTLTAPRGSKRAASIAREAKLPPGKYLWKIYVDRSGKLAQDETYELGPSDFIGQVEVDTRWPTGYGSMTSAKFPQ